MPKRSSKVRSALENLGQHAKKRKFSAQADKENKVNIGVLPGSIFTELDAAHII
jgi:hypothetical protein